MRNGTIAAILALTLVAPVAAALNLDGVPEETTERYIVAFTSDPGLRPGDAYQGERVVEFIDGLNFVVVETSNFAAFDLRARTDSNVRYVTWDNPHYGELYFTPNDALYGDAGHYGSKIVKAEGAWDVTTGSTAVKVAMIDSGLRKTHEDVAGSRVLQGYDFVNGDSDPNDEGSACSYHGSHTTGTAGATINNGKGIAGMSQHTILPIKAFYAWAFYCTSSTSALINSLKYAGDQGAHVSSNSWGSSADDASIADAVQYAHGKGTIHVAAAGNSGSCTDCVGYPWKTKGDITIVVSASDANDNFASYSSQGPQVDVIAPGSGVLSLSGSGDAAYQTMDGTSMSTPHVSGAVALYKALNPSASFTTVENAVKGTADDLGLSADRQGAGRLDACELVGSTTCTTSGGGGGGGETGTVHVHDIDHFRQGRDAMIQVWAFDGAEAPLSGVAVSVQVCKEGGSCATGTANTGSDGSVTFKWGKAGSGTYTTTVTKLALSGYTWDEAGGHAANGNSETETI